MTQDNLENEERELLAKLEAVRAEKARIAREKAAEEAKKIAPAKIHVTALAGRLVMFTYQCDRLRQDTGETLRTFSSFSRRYGIGGKDDCQVNATQWKELATEFLKLPEVSLTYNDGVEKAIDLYVNSPVWKVQLFMNFLAATPAPWNLETYIMMNQDGIIWNPEHKRYHVKFSSAYRLWELLKDIPGVAWEKSALDKVMQQVQERELIDNIATMKVAPEYADFDLNGKKLRPFQTVSQKFADLVGDRLILADTMGLGKSPQWIARAVIKNFKKSLIIVPAGLVSNWVRQIKMFAGVDPHIYTGRTPTRHDMARMMMGSDKFSIIPITSVGWAEKGKEGNTYPWVDIINMSMFDLIGVDEAHYVKNTSASRTQALLNLQAKRIWLLTGTPMTNRRTELYPLLRITRPDLNLTQPQIESMSNAALHEVLRQVMLRRDRSQVYDDLPPLDRITHLHELTEDARKRYAKAQAGLYEVIKTFNPHAAGSQQAIQNILVEIMRLKQICSDDMIEAAADLATEVYDSNEGEKYRKIIIFSQFNDVVRAVSARLGHEAMSINGDIHTPAERLNIIQKFESDPTKHFLVCSAKSVAEGFDITSAGYHINIDLMWTPAAHEQCEGRSYMRQSDPHGITVYYMIAKGTIMEWIWELLEAKMRDIEAVIDGTEKSRISGQSVANELIARMRDSTFTF